MQVREAADTLGVHYQTAYAWVRQGTLPARKTGRGYDVSDDDISALAERRASGAPPRPEVRVRDWSVQAGRLYDAIVSGDETLARHDFDRLALGVPLVDLCERVIAPALRRVGQRHLRAAHRGPRAPAAGPPARDRGDRNAARRTARAARADGGGLPAGGSLAGAPPGRGPAGR
jgi:excisionase family DNA binding protein